MSNFAVPILGFGDDGPIPSRVRWKDGTRLAYAGILGGVFDPEAQQAYEAEKARKQNLRDQGVTILEDHR